MQNEAHILRFLSSVTDAARFAPFLPSIVASLAVGGSASDPARNGNVLKMDDEIRSPDELYSLFEVKNEYPAGLDARGMAWISRRLLNVLGFAHANGVIHCAVLPMHVMIQPRKHKLVLVDWCSTVRQTDDDRPATCLSAGISVYKKESGSRRPATPSLDISFGAPRCMIDLLGGDPVAIEFLRTSVRRFSDICNAVSVRPGNRLDAWKLLEDFNRLIDALWGPRSFMELAMPGRGKK